MPTIESGRNAEKPPRPWVHLLPLVAIWLVPTLAVLVALPMLDAREQAIVRPGAPSTVTVGSRESDALTAVDIEVGLREGPSLLAGADGLVTNVLVSEGQPIAQGMPLVEVNYQRVLAFRGPSPLYRDLDLGDTGPDVSVLGGFLAELGLMPADEVSDEFGWSDRAAVKALQASIGADPNGRFSLNYLTYVSPDVATIGPLAVQIGDRVAASSPLTNDSKTATVVHFSPTDAQRSLAALGTGALLVLAGGEEFELSSIHPLDEEVGALQAFLVESETNGVVTVTASANGLSNKYTGTRLAMADPVKVGSVSNSALYVSPTGEQCVFEMDNERNSWVPHHVDGATALSGEIGVTAVDATLAGETVASDVSLLPASSLARC